MADKYREFTDRAKAFAADAYKDKTGDDDPMPQAIIEASDGITIMAIDPSFMATAALKNKLAAMITVTAKKAKARRVALLLPAWMVRQKGVAAEDYEGPEPSQHPDRVETMQVIVFDAERVEMWVAMIERGEEGSTLAPWNDDMGGEPMLEAEGRFIDPIREALR